MKNYFKLTKNIVFIALSVFCLPTSADTKLLSRILTITPSCALPGEKVSITGKGFGAHNVVIKVNGETAKLLNATGSTANFLVPIASLPGVTTVTVANSGGQDGSIDFQVKGHEICDNHIDDDCDGKVDEVDECPPAPLIKAWFDKSNANETIVAGTTLPLTTAINLRSVQNTPIVVNLSQSISPANNGISLSPQLNKTQMTFDSAGYKKFNQQLSAQLPGSYVITTLMTEPLSGKTEVLSRKITVIEQNALDVGVTLATQAYVPVGFNGQLQVGSTVAGNDYKKVTSVALKILETGQTTTLPKNGDVDYIGSVPLNTQNMSAGDCLSLQIEVDST